VLCRVFATVVCVCVVYVLFDVLVWLALVCCGLVVVFDCGFDRMFCNRTWVVVCGSLLILV